MFDVGSRLMIVMAHRSRKRPAQCEDGDIVCPELSLIGNLLYSLFCRIFLKHIYHHHMQSHGCSLRKRPYPTPVDLSDINKWPHILLDRACELWGEPNVRKQLRY